MSLVRASICSCILTVALASWTGAADFIRGDANNDGQVSAADVRSHGNYLFQVTPVPPTECLDALDVNDDGRIDIRDTMALVRFLGVGETPPASPFPGPGPDGAGTHLGCPSYGGGTALSDPAAQLKVRDYIAPGGDSQRAYVTIAVSHSGPIFGYGARIIDEAGILETDANGNRDYTSVLVEFTGRIDGGLVLAMAHGNEIQLLVGSSIHKPTALLPGEDYNDLQFPVCIKAGTPAGTYPLTLVSGELVDFASGRSIAPQLVSGNITLTAGVTGSSCVVAPGVDSNVVFSLKDAEGHPGEVVRVPFSIMTNRGAQAAMYSIDFNEQALEVVGVTPSWSRPDGQVLKLFEAEAFDADLIAGDGGLEEGTLGGIFHASYPEEGIVFPTNVELELLEIQFRVKDDAPLGTTYVRFRSGARTSHGTNPCEVFTIDGSHAYCFASYANVLRSGSSHATPETSDSFILVDAKLKIVGIVGDVSFFRGDANSDRKVNISDAIADLNHLYLGTQAPLCMDAADSNDDGTVDLSDAVMILSNLFTSGEPLPPPAYPTCGDDPTADSLLCKGHTSCE